MIVDTPNAAAKNIRVEGITWQGFNPFHIYLFNPNNLARLLEMAGLKIEKRFTYGNAPANRHSRSLTSRVARAARSNLPAPILGPLARTFFATRALGRRNGTQEENLTRAASAASAAGSYFDTLDAKQEFAADLCGDNMVVIARKE